MYQAKQTATNAANKAKEWGQELDDADLMAVTGGFLDISNNNIYIPNSIQISSLGGGGSGGSHYGDIK